MTKDYLDIEAFSCSGGLAKGFQTAGIDFDMVIEIEKEHYDSYEHNIGHRPICMDIRDLLRMLQDGWRPQKRVRIFTADPPCVAFSRSGLRLGTKDPRDMVAQTCEVIRLLRPDVFLIGNVPGLDDGPNLPIVQKHIGSLAFDGYCVADFVRLNASSYGVPQHRIRPLWYGHRAGPCIQWPEPTHGDPLECTDQLTLPGVRALLPWVTCGTALAHLKGDDLGRPVKLRRRTDAAQDGEEFTIQDRRGGIDGLNTLDAPSKTVLKNTHGNGAILKINDKHAPAREDAPAPTLGAKDRGQSANVLQFTDNHRPSYADEPAMVVRAGDGGGAVRAMVLEHETTIAPKRGRLRDRGRTGQGNRVGSRDEPRATVTAKASRVGAGAAHVLAWPWDRPSTTVQADDRLAPPGHHDETYATRSLPNAVVLSEKAAAVLQGFPPGWLFVGDTKKKRFSQIGQAFPPAVCAAVARSILAQLEATKPAPAARPAKKPTKKTTKKKGRSK